MQEFILTLEFIHIILGVLLPLTIRIYKGKNFGITILIGWGLIIIWGITWLTLLPMILSPFVSDEILLMFPEAIGGPFILLFGWIQSIALCLAGLMIVEFIKFCQKRRKPIAIDTSDQPEQPPTPEERI